MNNSFWWYCEIIYTTLALLTLIPVLCPLLNKVKLHDGGISFSESPHFNDENKNLLTQHFSRMKGTLVFWKNQAELYKRYHNYTLLWTIPVSLIIPLTVQVIDSEASKIFLTTISIHTAIILAFHRALKVENNYKSFRHGESEFYDLYRKLLDRPLSFGENEKQQIDAYFIEVEKIRKIIRNAETDNIPKVNSNIKATG